jgi:NADH-quinone oxidoreductase subunit L
MHARIHDTDKSQDMRNMGGLAKHLPVTRWTFLVSCLAIAGVPPLAGFWSKDEILWEAFSTHVTTDRGTSDVPMWTWPDWLGPAIFWVGIVAATMTAFYMFRAYFMTFHGTFRGWKIVRGWKGAAHGHDHDEEGPLVGPPPHESPWPMTLPLVILAAFAVFAGFLNAAALHMPSFEALGTLLEPVFARAHHAIGARVPEGMEKTMMLPGLGAFAVGTGLAYVVYYQGGGAQERAFAKSFPGLYKLVYDKWRIDELYDAVVVGMVDALADILLMADRWIIDGILARLTAALTAAAGTIARAFQTGRVQAYSASMVVGLAGLGWFILRPHAVVALDEGGFKQNGQITLLAAPGLGYRYHWEVPGGPKSEGFSATREVTVTLQPGETKEVVLEVENAFHSVAREVVPLSRPSAGAGRRSIIEIGGAR